MLTISAGVVSDAGDLDDPSNREGWSMDDFVSRLESGWLDWDELTASEKAVAEGREPFVKHGTHDQSSHGNWARHGVTIEWDSSATPAKGEHKKTYGFTEIGQVVTPLADALFQRSGQKGGNLAYRPASEVKRFVARAIADRMDASGHLTDDDWYEYVRTHGYEDLTQAWRGTDDPNDVVSLYEDGDDLLVIDQTTAAMQASSQVQARLAEPGSPEARALVKEFLVSRHVKAWATSSTRDDLSVAMQNVVQSSFGLKDAWKVPTHHQVSAVFDNPNSSKWLTECARAQYEFTQETLKDAGIDSLVVFRGTRNLSGNVPVSWSASDFPARRSMESGIKVRTSPLSSWSVYESDAQQFGIGSPGGVITRMVVPRERIFSTPLTGFGCLDENEIVVLGGEYTVDAFNATSGSASHGPVVVKFAPGLRPVLKHGTHDQKSHGNWARGGKGAMLSITPEQARANAKFIFDTALPFMYGGSRVRETWDNPAYDWLDHRVTQREDRALRQVLNARGIGNQCEVASDARLDELIAQGGVEQFRGAPDGNENVRDGSKGLNAGLWGSGLYMTSDPEYAAKYEHGKEAGGVARIVIKPGSKIASLPVQGPRTGLSGGGGGDLTGDNYKALFGLFEDYGFDPVMGTDDASNTSLSFFWGSDNGRLAALMGYDAVRIPFDTGEEWYLVVNPEAIAIGEKNVAT